MSKKTSVLTSIDTAKIQAICEGHGCTFLAQSQYVKITGPAKGRQVYVPKTRTTSRVDISGFTCPVGDLAIVDLGDASFGSVRQQLDFSRSEDEILATLDAVIEHMVGLEDAPPRAKVGQTKGGSAQGWSAAVVPAKAARAAE